MDDPTVLLMRVRLINTSATAKGTARLRLSSADAAAETLVIEGDRVWVRRPDGARLRCLFETGGRGTLAQAGNASAWSLELCAGRVARRVGDDPLRDSHRGSGDRGVAPSRLRRGQPPRVRFVAEAFGPRRGDCYARTVAERFLQGTFRAHGGQLRAGPPRPAPLRQGLVVLLRRFCQRIGDDDHRSESARLPRGGRTVSANVARLPGDRRPAGQFPDAGRGLLRRRRLGKRWV